MRPDLATGVGRQHQPGQRLTPVHRGHALLHEVPGRGADQQRAALPRGGGVARPGVQAAQPVALERGAGFHLHRPPLAGALDQQVDLIDSIAAPEIHAVGQAMVAQVLQVLGHQHVLDQGTTHRVVGQRLGAADAQQPGSQTGVVEVQLGRLYQPLAEVAVIRRQPESDGAGLQHRHRKAACQALQAIVGVAFEHELRRFSHWS